MADEPHAEGGYVQGGGRGTGPGVELDGEKPPGWYGALPLPGRHDYVPPMTMAGGEAIDGRMRLGPGMRVRLTRIKDRTPKGILHRRLYLPAVLNEFTVEETAEFADFTTHARGEFSVPAQGGKKARSLRDLPIEFLTLDWDADWLVEQRSPKVVKDELQRIIRSKAPVMLLAIVRFKHGAQPIEFRGAVTLRRTARTLKPGEADTRYWQLEFKDDRELHSTRRVKTTKGKRNIDLPTRFKIDDTTTLEWLSKHFYGSTRYWHAIRAFNGLGKWGPRTPLVEHHRLKFGSSVKIPIVERGTGPGVETPLRGTGPGVPSPRPSASVRSF